MASNGVFRVCQSGEGPTFARLTRNKASFMRTKLISLLYKTNRFHVAVNLSSNRSQRTSNCNENISDTLGYRLVCHFLCSYHILTSSVIYYWTDARQHGIYLLNVETWSLSSPAVLVLDHLVGKEGTKKKSSYASTTMTFLKWSNATHIPSFRVLKMIKMISARHSSNGKIKLPKKSHSMVIFWVNVRWCYRDLALKPTPWEKIELEAKHITCLTLTVDGKR